MTEQKKRGGSRAGAGRKPAGPEPLNKRLSLWVTQKTKDKAERIGKQAVRDAIDAAPEPQEPSKE